MSKLKDFYLAEDMMQEIARGEEQMRDFIPSNRPIEAIQ